MTYICSCKIDSIARVTQSRLFVFVAVLRTALISAKPYLTITKLLRW